MAIYIFFYARECMYGNRNGGRIHYNILGEKQARHSLTPRGGAGWRVFQLSETTKGQPTKGNTTLSPQMDSAAGAAVRERLA